MAGGQAVGHLQGTASWTSGSVFNAAPIPDGTVLVDTGALTAGNYLVAVAGSGSVAWAYDVQWRTAANTANNAAQRRRNTAGPDDLLFGNKVTIAASERFRVVLVGDTTGEVQCSLMFMEVG